MSAMLKLNTEQALALARNSLHNKFYESAKDTSIFLSTPDGQNILKLIQQIKKSNKSKNNFSGFEKIAT